MLCTVSDRVSEQQAASIATGLQATLAASGIAARQTEAEVPGASPGSNKKRNPNIFDADIPKPQALFDPPVNNSRADWQPRWAVTFQVCHHQFRTSMLRMPAASAIWPCTAEHQCMAAVLLADQHAATGHGHPITAFMAQHLDASKVVMCLAACIWHDTDSSQV